MGMTLGGGNGGRGGRRRPNNRFSEINITPMVDVMLVLLIIFMVAAPMMTTGVTVDLPKSNASPIAGQDEPLAVSVTAGGKIFVQKTEVPINALAEKLKAITGEKKDTRIFVRGDRNVDYGKVMEVVSAINTAGYGKVALITDVGANNNGKDK